MRNVNNNYVSRRNRPGSCPASVLFSHTYDSYGNVLTETVPYVTGLPLCRSYDELQRPSGIRLGEADCDYTYICFNNDAVRCIRRISTTAESIKLEFAMGAWANRANLTYQPLNTTFRYNGIDYDDFGRPASHPHYKKHRERLAPYLILADSAYRVGYSYDEASRLAAVTAFGQSAAYIRMPGANRLTATVFKNGNTPIHAAFRTYDDFNRLTGVNGYGYTLNDKDQRTKLTLTDDTTWDYSYDGFSQVIGGVKKDGATELANHAYTYDQIGNRVTATTGAAITEYTANLLNQYTAIDEEVPTYDLDGNMLTNGEWTYTWNIENRLTAAENATTKLEYLYDYMGRRTTKKVYTQSGTAWTLQTTKTFVYDGFKQIAELTDNVVTMHTVWQPPSSGDFDVPLWTKTGNTVQVYILDGNKNVRQLKNTAGTVIANYDYDPFGNVSSTGTPTPWQFSSEYRDEETALVYYNYRYYDPKLGRWTKRDLISERGGANLYCFIGNGSVFRLDRLGLAFEDDIDNIVDPNQNPNIPENWGGEIASVGEALLPRFSAGFAFDESMVAGAINELGYGGEVEIPLSKVLLIPIPPYGSVELLMGAKGSITCCRRNAEEDGLMFIGGVTFNLSAGIGTIIGGQSNTKLGRTKNQKGIQTFHPAIPQRGRKTDPFLRKNYKTSIEVIAKGEKPICRSGMSGSVGFYASLTGAAIIKAKASVLLGKLQWPGGAGNMDFKPGDFEATVNAGVAAELGIRLAIEVDAEIMAMVELL